MRIIRCSECKKEYDYNLKVCPHCRLYKQSKADYQYTFV